MIKMITVLKKQDQNKSKEAISVLKNDGDCDDNDKIRISEFHKASVM